MPDPIQAGFDDRIKMGYIKDHEEKEAENWCRVFGLPRAPSIIAVLELTHLFLRRPIPANGMTAKNFTIKYDWWKDEEYARYL